MADQTKKKPFMFERALAMVADANRPLIICGSLHLDGLAERFRNAGYAVAVEDLRKQSWY